MAEFIKSHYRVLISTLSLGDTWKIVVNPRWNASMRACNQILLSFANDYAEYKNCGVIYRMIRVRDLEKYGINEVKPEWVLNPDMVRIETGE